MSMRAAAVLALPILIGAAPYPKDEPDPGFCNRLTRIVDAAYERHAFVALATATEATRRFMQGCTLSGSGEYLQLRCERRAAPTTDLWFRLNSDIQSCIPRAIRMAEPDDGRRFARFRFDIIAIHTEHRNVGMRGGSILSYTVMRLPIH